MSETINNMFLKCSSVSPTNNDKPQYQGAKSNDADHKEKQIASVARNYFLGDYEITRRSCVWWPKTTVCYKYKKYQ